MYARMKKMPRNGSRFFTRKSNTYVYPKPGKIEKKEEKQKKIAFSSCSPQTTLCCQPRFSEKFSTKNMTSQNPCFNEGSITYELGQG